MAGAPLFLGVGRTLAGARHVLAGHAWALRRTRRLRWA